MDNAHFEFLGNNTYVLVSKEHHFGTDAILLADFSKPGMKEKVCDLGTGCGIIPMLWCRSNCADDITALDIQEEACKQAELSAIKNQVDSKVHIICDDLKNVKALFKHGSFDAVTMNPPYKAANTGIESKSDYDAIARHETACLIDDVASAAAHMLKFGGKLFLCNRPERLCDTIFAMKNHGIEPKRLRFVAKNERTDPWLFLIEGKKGGKPFLKVEAGLNIYNKENEYCEEMIKIYGEYKEK